MSRKRNKKNKDIKIGALRLKTDIPEITLTIPNIIILIGLILIVADILLFSSQVGSRTIRLPLLPFGLAEIRLIVLGALIIILALVLDHFIDFKGEEKEEPRTGIRAFFPKRGK